MLGNNCNFCQLLVTANLLPNTSACSKKITTLKYQEIRFSNLSNPPRYIAWSHGRLFSFPSAAEPNNPHDSHIKWQQIYCGRWPRQHSRSRSLRRSRSVKLSDNGRRTTKSGPQWDSGNCNVLLSPLRHLRSSCLRAGDPTLDSCVPVCCCAFAALIPFNTNRIDRSAISCDENINKKTKKA